MKNTQNEEKNTSFFVAFGVGSWEFGLNLNEPFHLNVHEYCDLLESELGTIASLTDLDINYDEDDAIEFSQKDFEHAGNVSAVFPGHSIFDFSFGLYIPLRIQRELLGAYFEDGVGTENFLVYNRNVYHGWVCYVVLVDSQKDTTPSTAIRLVREYLKMQIRLISTKLVFRFVGPSPFHADFWIKSDKEKDQYRERFLCERIHGEGYSTITFRCCSDEFSSADDACRKSFGILDYEMDLFYQIHRNNIDQFDQWGHIAVSVDRMYDQIESTNGFKNIGTHIRSGGQLSKLHVALVRFESMHIHRIHQEDRSFSELYDGGRPTFLKSFVEASISGRPVFATKQTKDLVAYIEARRTKAIEWIVVVAAGLVGGIAGSIAALMVR